MQTQDQELNSIMNAYEEGCLWVEAVENEICLKLTDLERDRIFDFATESMYDETPYAVGQRITKETTQFRQWYKNIKLKRLETTEEEAMEWFEYLDPDEFVVTDREMDVFVSEAVERLESM